MGLAPSSYELLLNFFQAKSWRLGEVMLQWMQWCQQSFDLVYVQERLVCIGDGIKVPKEAKRQPGLKWMHHSSQNNNKPNRFIGQHFGCIAFVAFCVKSISGDITSGSIT
ncbi:hypothetical protein [Candidatus Venteria ishoeyi]|uniref:hypothetical protein n=1 Tax=Candidatus Venteria ishoeyi TaxID=1899563 RepID=UPI0015AA9657|nr:hypothetical protein [Candidatus Venteria ishoeyi]